MTKVALRPNGYGVPGFSNLFENILENEFPTIFKTEWKHSLPPVNIRETKDAYLVDVMASGFTKENFNVKAEENILTISAEVKENKQEEGEKFTRKEFVHSSFNRSFTLPKTVVVDNITAAYENGILKVTLPKIEEAKAKGTIEVKIS